VLSLFADQIAATQHDPDEEMALRTVRWVGAERDRRRERAAGWRRARARPFALEPDLRRTIGSLWRTCLYPADESYLAELLHQIAVGRLDPTRPP